MNKDAPMFQISTPNVPLTLLHVHGKNDLSVLVNGGETVRGLDMGRIDKSMQQALDLFSQANKCNTNSTTVWERFTGATMNFTRRNDCNKPVMTLLLEADHSWSNMNAAVSTLHAAPPYHNIAYKSLATVISSIMLNFQRQ